MRYNDFSFTTENLDYEDIENAICARCGLDYPQTSGETVKEGGMPSALNITTMDGRVSCRVTAYKKPGDDFYTVEVRAVEVIHKKRY